MVPYLVKKQRSDVDGMITEVTLGCLSVPYIVCIYMYVS